MTTQAKFQVEVRGIDATPADLQALREWITTGTKAGLWGNLRRLRARAVESEVTVTLLENNGSPTDGDMTLEVTQLRENLINEEKVPNTNARERIINDVCVDVAYYNPEIEAMADDLAAALPDIGRKAALRILAACGLALRDNEAAD